ncbi:hypothetical protein Bbelb_265190 [Branchiostoma belcheri]|nr:hypothetical protein Bbelb_265190 [Branchiostoma belcheri]
MALYKTRLEQAETSRTEPLQASSSATGASINIVGCDPLKDDGDAKSDTCHPFNTLHTAAKRLPNARDPNPTYKRITPNSVQMDADNVGNPNPTYKQTTPNARDPNPMYPQHVQAPQPSVGGHEPDAFSPGMDTPNIQPHAASRGKVDEPEPTITPASNDDNAGIQAHALATYQNVDEHVSIPTNNSNPRAQPYAAAARLQDDETAASPARSDDDVCLQAYGATQHNDVTTLRSAISDDDLHIQPYAVRYQDGDDDGNTLSTAVGTADENGQIDGIKPYATAYMCPDDDSSQQDRGSGETRPKELLQNENSVSGRSNDIPTATGMTEGNSARNDAYTAFQNALKPNPMYLPNVRKDTAKGNVGCTYRRMCVAAVTVACLAVLLFIWAITRLYFNGSNQDTQMPTSAVGTTSTYMYTSGGHPTNCGFERTEKTALMFMFTVSSTFVKLQDAPLTPTFNSSQRATVTLYTESSNNPQDVTFPSTISGSQRAKLFKTSNNPQSTEAPSTFDSSQETHGVNSQTEKIVFGGTGSAPGEFWENRAVAVSADNEIFVTDRYNTRIQVFNINGDFLRLFPTNVSAKGEEKIRPRDVSIDGEGHVWVVGQKKYIYDHPVHVVQYSRDGVPLTNFGVRGRSKDIAMTVDVPNNKIIVILHVVHGEIMMFHPNGSFYMNMALANPRKFHQFLFATHHGGRTLVTDYKYSNVQVFNHSGRWLYEFGRSGRSEGELKLPRGICTDSSGRFIVANGGNGRIDMFTSRGEFVRTVVRMNSPWGIALGPGGQLVVTDVDDNTVTIFPPKFVFP